MGGVCTLFFFFIFFLFFIIPYTRALSGASRESREGMEKIGNRFPNLKSQHHVDTRIREGVI